MHRSSQPVQRDRRILAWATLVVGSALLIVGVRLIYELPADLRYRYSTLVRGARVSTATGGRPANRRPRRPARNARPQAIVVDVEARRPHRRADRRGLPRA